MKNKLKCYISSPASFDLTKIETTLNQLDIDYHSFYDFSIGTTFSDLIKRKLRESDFVIGILENENSNVLFELGVAEGLSKPTFIIIVGKEMKIPFFLQNKLYFQTNFKETKLIELALSNFIIDVKEKKTKLLNRKKKREFFRKENTEDIIAQNSIIDVKEKKTKLVNKINEFLTKEDTENIIAQIQSIRINPNDADIFHLIKETFSKLYIQNASISTAPIDKGADFVIRSNKLSPYFGNPILVEIKSGHLSQNKIKDTQERLWSHISKSDAKGGIILYLDKNDSRYENETFVYPLILSIDLEDFILGIASEGLEKFLIKKRNELAHGIKK